MNDSQATPSQPEPPRLRWETPQIRRHGSVKRLVRAASGRLGDPSAGGIGKRNR